jgi:hypothetical protein
LKTRQQLEDWMKTHPRLEFPKVYTAENARLASQADIYWKLVDQGDGFPPLQDAFAHNVASATPNAPVAGVHARACRAYPSWIRQHHLITILREQFDRVIWSTEWDHTGVDISVSYHGLSIGIASAVDTARSNQYEKVKQGRHPDDGHLYIIRLYATKDEYQIGPFWLHNPDKVKGNVLTFAEGLRAA